MGFVRDGLPGVELEGIVGGALAGFVGRWDLSACFLLSVRPTRSRPRILFNFFTEVFRWCVRDIANAIVVGDWSCGLVQ